MTPPPATGTPYVVGASIGVNLDFSKLPLVGSIPGFEDLTLTNVGFSYTNTDPTSLPGQQVVFHIPAVTTAQNPLYTRSDPHAPNSKVYTISSSGPAQAFSLTSSGFALTAGFNNKRTGQMLNSFALPLALPSTAPPANGPPAPYATGTTSPPGSSVHWINIDKVFGPVSLQQIGLNYSGGEATFGFSAGFSMGGFSLGLLEMSITFPLPLPGQTAGSKVSFDLEGLTFGITEPGFVLGGAFLRAVTDGITAYYGEILAQVGQFGFKVLGGYTPAQAGKPPSFFLYACINAPLGGEPYLYLTGLAGGFGINNSLKLPTIAQLPTYILLPLNAPAQGANAQTTIASVLPLLEEYFVNEPGEFWIAAGIQFTSFQMINAFALVTVSFGVEFQVGLLGSCSMSLPTGEPLAYVEIDILASFTPKSGLIAVVGVLSPASYLFGPFVQLTGGFAFYIWFSGPQQGEFVVTLGGYNPFFSPPDYYPIVPRLGINFALGAFRVTGGCYYALTPAMFMAGLSLSAVWESGPVKAWFNLGADFLIGWAPLHYSADAYINLGCSVNVGLFTLNLHIGADLTIWGPPFAGKADIDLDVISFTIQFGTPSTKPGPLGWQDFKTSFLPADSTSPGTSPHRVLAASAKRTSQKAVTDEDSTTNIIKGNVTQGLLGTDEDGFDWIVAPDNFNILITLSIPANSLLWALSTGNSTTVPNDPTQYNSSTVDVTNGPYLVFDISDGTFDATQIWNPTVSIRPMNQNSVQSEVTIQLLKQASDGTYTDYISNVSMEPVLTNSCAALWATAPSSLSPNDDAFAKFALTGFQLFPIPRTPDTVNGVPLNELLYQQGNDAYFSYSAAAVDTVYTLTLTFPTPSEIDIAISGAYSETIQNSNYLLGALMDPWVASQRATILDDLVANGFSTYAASQVDLTILATETALTDWPEVMLLGNIISQSP